VRQKCTKTVRDSRAPPAGPKTEVSSLFSALMSIGGGGTLHLLLYKTYCEILLNFFSNLLFYILISVLVFWEIKTLSNLFVLIELISEHLSNMISFILLDRFTMLILNFNICMFYFVNVLIVSERGCSPSIRWS